MAFALKLAERVITALTSTTKAPAAASRSRRHSALLLRVYINDETDLCGYKLSKALDELEKRYRVTEAGP